MDGNDPKQRGETNLPTVGSGRLDALFDDLESTIESLDRFGDELETVRRRIEADEAGPSGAVVDRINDDADQLADDAEASAERIVEELRSLKRAV